MTTSGEETLAGRLSIGVEQFRYLGERIRKIGCAVGDLAAVADYLRELGEHGASVVHLALEAIDEVSTPHPLLSSDGGEVEVFLIHARALLEATQTFAAECYGRLPKPNEGCPE